MKILFHTISSYEKAIDFSIKDDKNSVNLKGNLNRINKNFVQLQAKLSGVICLDCDICANEYEYYLNEDINFKISDKPFNTKNSDELLDDEYDIIEFLDGIIDIKEIVLSEINAIKCDYHYCDKCK